MRRWGTMPRRAFHEAGSDAERRIQARHEKGSGDGSIISIQLMLNDPGSSERSSDSIATDLVRLVRRHRFPLAIEKSMQEEIERVLLSEGISFEREKHLSERDIPDFLVASGIVIECKRRGAKKMPTYKQLWRYAQYDTVRAIVLASNLDMGLPPAINGKSLYAASISWGWM